jgi:lipoprotein-releasing system ATP-binding protein
VAATLQLTDIKKEYPTPTEPLVVLRGITLSLGPGDSLAILGPSGSGKSTLLNILGTLDTPTSGSFTLDGTDPLKLSAADLAKFRAHNIGFIFQDHHLLPQCTALENILITKLATGKVTDPDIQRGKDLLAKVSLTDRATHLPSELSGGERQRVAIARALMNQPKLLLCDEPTGNLDSKTSATIGELLVNLAAETNAILIAVTHSAQLASLFHTQLHMSDGILIRQGKRVE